MIDYQKQLRQLINKYSKHSPLNILAEIKRDINPNDYEHVINSYSFLKALMTKGLKFANVDNVYQREVLIFTNDLKRELFWLLYNFKQEATFINSFLNKKNRFEKLFILCQYKEAQEELNEIRQVFGESLWTIEMSLLLKEYQFETKENWIGLSDFLTKIKSPFYQFIINFYSKRIEENMSFENCFTLFQNDFDGINADETVKEFFVFKSLFIANFEYTYPNLEGVIYISGLFGILDQYLIIVEVLQKLVAQNNTNDKLISQFIKKIYPYIPDDHHLSNILNLIDKKTELIVLPETNFILPIIDDYSCGKFEQCLDACTSKLKEYPHSFELYEIYVKALINLNLDFQPTQISPFIDKIGEVIFKALLYNKDSDKHRNKLLKYAITFISFDIGKKLFAFGAELVGDSFLNTHTIISCLSSSNNNPKLFSLNLNNREEITIEKFKHFQDSVSYKINKFIKGYGSIDDIIETNGIQSIIYQARHYFNQSDFGKAIKLVEPYIQQPQMPLFYYDSITSILFDSYLKSNQLVSAMSLSTSIITNKVFYTNKFNIHNLTQKIKDEGLDKYAAHIDLPILFSMVYKEYDLYEVYIEFMLYNNEEYPSRLDIDSLISQFSLEKVIYFLKDVCNIATLGYSLEFSSINEVEQERCNICNLLKSLDEENTINYDKEIAEIIRSGAVRKAIKEVDEGRLYVNIESLKNLQLNNIKESFSRYKEIEFTTKDKSLIGFNASKERDWNSSNFQQNDTYSELNNPAFLAFKSIYLETRDKFLYSKEYGLESCISGKIRHGTLRNLLRSVFDKLNLVTSKSGEKYLDNIYWHNQFGFDADTNLKVQKRLKLFSKDIDDTTNFIVEKLMQIKTEKSSDKPHGLFNYSTNDEALLNFYESYKESFDNYNSLVSRIYLDLAAVTSLHLVPYIQDVLSTNIKNKFQEFIEQLQVDIRNINIPYHNDLLANISKSSTDIQIVIDSVLEWFKFNTSYSSSLLDIVTILNASKELTNKFNPNCCINPEIEIKYPEDLSIISSTAMIFVFHILMDNIIKHSKLSSSEIKVKIILQQKDNFIEVQVMNNVSPYVDIGLIKSNLEQVSQNWNNHEDIERSTTEEGSGFHKIKRLLLYEALSKTDKFDYFVNEYQVSISLFLPFNQYNNA